MQKKDYINAEIEILYFDKKDVITASAIIPPDIDDPNNSGRV